MFAEQAYLFRHALLRDAAYQLQLPGERARLHALAIDIYEELLPHNTAEIALELADHAHAASEALPDDGARCGYAQRELGFLSRAGQVAERRFRFAECVEIASRLLGHPAVTTSGRAEALRLRGTARSRADDWQAAEHDLMAALEISEPLGQLDILFNLGNLLRGTNRCKLAEDRFAQAHELALRIRPESVPSALGGRALSLGLQGQLPRALEMFNEALKLEPPLAARARLLSNRANLLQTMGRWNDSLSDLEESLRICPALGDRDFEGVVRSGFALALKMLGRLQEAKPEYERAIEIACVTGNRRNEGVSRGNLGELLMDQGEFSSAEAQLFAALVIHRETGNLRFQGNVLTSLGTLASVRGEHERASTWYDEAVRMHRASGNSRGLGIAMGNASYVERDRGRLATAVEMAREAVKILETAGDPANLAIARGHLASHLCLSGQLAEALAVLPLIGRSLLDAGLTGLYCEYALMPELRCALAGRDRAATAAVLNEFRKSDEPRCLRKALELAEMPGESLVAGFSPDELTAATRAACEEINRGHRP